MSDYRHTPGPWKFSFEQFAPEWAVVTSDGGDIEDDDPSPYCQYCGAMTEAGCKCGPIADNH